MDTHGEEKQDSAAAALLSTSGDSVDDHGVDDHGDLVNSAVVRGKRTKRQRSQQPVLSLAITSPDSSSSASSATAAVDVPALTQEEEDMAHCLILLAQGRAFEPPKLEPAVAGAPAPVPAPAPDKFTSRRFAEAATTTNGKAGFYVYECKTCRKCFPSFQALGGHRTSHKKPKTMAVAPPPAENLLAGDDLLQISMNSFARPLASAKSKVHECAICGSEFSSGQALGGHMRRHRPLLAAGDMQGSKKEKTFLSLDLNLPASPAADEQRCPPPSPSPSISLGSKQPLVFSPPASAPALAVHCHY